MKRELSSEGRNISLRINLHHSIRKIPILTTIPFPTTCQHPRHQVLYSDPSLSNHPKRMFSSHPRSYRMVFAFPPIEIVIRINCPLIYPYHLRPLLPLGLFIERPNQIPYPYPRNINTSSIRVQPSSLCKTPRAMDWASQEPEKEGRLSHVTTLPLEGHEPLMNR